MYSLAGHAAAFDRRCRRLGAAVASGDGAQALWIVVVAQGTCAADALADLAAAAAVDVALDAGGAGGGGDVQGGIRRGRAIVTLASAEGPSLLRRHRRHRPEMW